MEKVISHIRPIECTEGDVYGFHFRLSGTMPSVTIHWGDGKSETFWGNEIFSEWEDVPDEIYYGLHLFAEYLPEMQND